MISSPKIRRTSGWAMTWAGEPEQIIGG